MSDPKEPPDQSDKFAWDDGDLTVSPPPEGDETENRFANTKFPSDPDERTNDLRESTP